MSPTSRRAYLLLDPRKYTSNISYHFFHLRSCCSVWNDYWTFRVGLFQLQIDDKNGMEAFSQLQQSRINHFNQARLKDLVFLCIYSAICWSWTSESNGRSVAASVQLSLRDPTFKVVLASLRITDNSSSQRIRASSFCFSFYRQCCSGRVTRGRALTFWRERARLH